MDLKQTHPIFFQATHTTAPQKHPSKTINVHFDWSSFKLWIHDSDFIARKSWRDFNVIITTYFDLLSKIDYGISFSNSCTKTLVAGQPEHTQELSAPHSQVQGGGGPS